MFDVGMFQTYLEGLTLEIEIEITLIQLYNLLFVENDKLNLVLFDYLAYLEDTNIINCDEHRRLKTIAENVMSDEYISKNGL